jgi:predicted  nucleic acid-binding Zn-ribbon protein
LGVRKTKALTLLDKPVTEKYLKGGPLGDIPHDDVSTMTASELETEVRKLRKKTNDQKEQHKKELAAKLDEIKDLTMRVSNTEPPTKAQKAARELRALTGEYSMALSKISAGFREAMSILDEGEKIPGAGIQELNAWLNEFVPDSATIRDLFSQWQAGFDDPSPIVDNFNDIIEGKVDV